MLILIKILAVLFLFILIITTILWCLIKSFQKKGRGQSPTFWKYLCLAILLEVIAASGILYGHFVGRWQYRVNHVILYDADLPDAFDEYHIVHISDFHLEGFNDNPSYVDTLVNAINALNADAIFFTGDLVSYNSDGVIPYIYILKKLKSKDGVYSILGNHDYGIYDKNNTPQQCEKDRSRLIQIQRDSLGWNLLLNESRTIYHNQDSICIVGCENQACGFKQKVRRGKLDKALEGIESPFVICLTHDPSHWDAEILQRSKIKLTFSGHTHAMQCSVDDWTPSRIFFKRSDGLYKERDQQLYVNTGLGGLIPFRIGAKPEITFITLKKQ